MRWIALVALIAGCSVNRKTDALQCAVSTDCEAPRVCEQGYCVVDPDACPTRCDGGCDLSTSPPTCRMTTTGGDAFHCPSNMQCDITCASSGDCGDITCSDYACTISCLAPGACGNIDCSSSCGCDVTCAAGACGVNDCPSHGGVHCTSDGTTNAGSTCASNRGGCNTCP